MKATLTEKGQITIPARLRKRWGLKPGQVIEFDENAPFLQAAAWLMRSALAPCLAA
ncbi:MAG: prlF antitoxin for toxin YhaV toxin [Verrucomicrobiota bacterium]|jgi:AbrB family looped-hinge helix DNA binding protein